MQHGQGQVAGGDGLGDVGIDGERLQKRGSIITGKLHEGLAAIADDNATDRLEVVVCPEIDEAFEGAALQCAESATTRTNNLCFRVRTTAG